MIKRILTLYLFLISSNLWGRDVISLSPLGTEILFHLNEGNRVSARCKFCDFPEKAKELPVVGDYYGLQLEKIIKLKPKWALFEYSVDKSQQKQLNQFGIKSIELSSNSLEELRESYKKIESSLGIKDATKIVALHDSFLSELPQCFKGKRVVFSIGRTASSLSKPTFTVAGKKSLYGEIISLIGAKGVEFSQFKEMGFEELLSSSTDYFIDLYNDSNANSAPDFEKNFVKTLRKYKSSIKYVPITSTYATRPGPRFYKLKDDLQRICDGDN